ncbi:MAG: RecX family transcriptional regulator [bacterium]|nr:RecX family transcriptional regulator [bacterium]
MEINKFKKVGKSKYKLVFNNTDITIYEDIILKYNLLIKNDIDEELLDKIIEENRYYEAYYTALSYIEIRMRNKKEINIYLTKKGYDKKYIEFAISKLEELNLLNDNSYIVAFINDKVNLSNDGPNKIKKNLLDLDFNERDIDSYLSKIDDEVWNDKIKKIINKKKSLMKSKSYYMFILKMKNDLYNLGYDKNMIDDNLSNIEYVSNAIEKDFDKCFKKFKGDKTKILNSMIRKGYSYEEVNSLFNK